MAWITDGLIVGLPTDPSADCWVAFSSDEALQVIGAGGTAVLPESAWNMAEVVLCGLGLKPDEIDDLLFFHRLGADP